jgi:iron only hydrogenase large subunit-like protein
LNESQKLKVIAQFDKATTAKEAKTIFESMNSAIAKANKSTLKESIGFASKAAGMAPKKPIVDETMSRWQMLAGITKY